ncbi:hypothetical protein Trydic_g1376 [Trypoxylus dichotomus]
MRVLVRLIKAAYAGETLNIASPLRSPCMSIAFSSIYRTSSVSAGGDQLLVCCCRTNSQVPFRSSFT